MNGAAGIAWVAGGVLVLLAAGVALAWLLRRCGIPGGRTGAAIVAGILAGVLLGPGVAGRVAPGPFQRAFVGALAEQRAVNELADTQRRDVEVVQEAGVTPDYLVELEAKHAKEMAPLLQAARAARAERRSLLDAVVGALIALHLLLVGLVCAPMGRMMRRALRRAGGLSPGDAAGAAGMMVVVAMVTPILTLMWILRAPAREAVGVALAMGVPALGAEARPRLLPSAAIGIVGCVAALGYLTWHTGSPWLGAAIAIGTLAALALTLSGAIRLGRAPRRALAWLMLGVLLPGITALATLRCDPHTLAGSREFWIVAITAALFSSDGRWVGVGWAQKLFPRAVARALPGARTWTGASGLVNAGTGLAQLAAALALEAAGVITAQALAGLILGAAAIELSRGIRIRVGLMMDGGGEVTSDQ